MNKKTLYHRFVQWVLRLLKRNKSLVKRFVMDKMKDMEADEKFKEAVFEEVWKRLVDANISETKLLDDLIDTVTDEVIRQLRGR